MSDLLPGSIWYIPSTNMFIEMLSVRDNTHVTYKFIEGTQILALYIDEWEDWQEDCLQFVAPKLTRLVELLYL